MQTPTSPHRDPAEAATGTAAAVTAVAVVASAAGMPADEVHVPVNVARSLRLKEGMLLDAKAGNNTVRAAIRIADAGGPIRLSASVANRLTVGPTRRLHVRHDVESAALTFGPFIGILALRSRRGPAYGEHEPFFRVLTAQGTRLAVAAFMFSPRDVRWETQRIVGYVFTPVASGGVWRRHTFPFPDIVYDRMQTRRAEARAGYIQFRRRLRDAVGGWFNEPGFFDKWRLHSLLSENERLRPYLPETRRYAGAEDLEHILRSYATAYVKPVAGSLGLGIMRVRRLRSGFTIHYEVGERTVTRGARTLAALHRTVYRLTRGQPYIVQQGLRLATWHGRPFDVRVLMQRTATGKWAVTKMFGRVAALGGVTSNLTRGAEASNIHLLLRHVFGRRHRSRLYKQLYAAGMHCAEQISQTLPGLVGELGLDLGVSRGGRIWLIEANSKPFLQMTRESGSRRTLALSVRRPLQFGTYQAGF